MRSIVAAGAILFAASASSAQTRSADEAAIHAQTAAYESALNKRDPAAVAALFVPDGDLVFFDSPRVSGRDALIQNTKDAVATWPATMRFTLSITAIRWNAGLPWGEPWTFVATSFVLPASFFTAIGTCSS